MVANSLLVLLPILAVSLPLLAGRFLGERTLLAIRASRMPRPASRLRAPVRTRHAGAVLFVRCGELIGRSLAVRPPPLLAPTAS